mgnify:CR=1 FL=1
MSETIKLCAMLVRHVFAPDDEARDEEMRRPFVEQAMRAKREHDEMRRELAEARATVTLLTEQRACDFRVMEGAQSLIAELTQERDASDDTRREWEVRAATSYAAGRAAGLREAAAKLAELRDEWEVMMGDGSVAHNCGKIAHGHVIALAPPAAEPRDEGES